MWFQLIVELIKVKELLDLAASQMRNVLKETPNGSYQTQVEIKVKMMGQTGLLTRGLLILCFFKVVYPKGTNEPYY